MKKIALVLFVLITLGSASLFAKVVVTKGKQSCSGTNIGYAEDSFDCLNKCQGRTYVSRCFDPDTKTCYCK